MYSRATGRPWRLTESLLSWEISWRLQHYILSLTSDNKATYYCKFKQQTGHFTCIHTGRHLQKDSMKKTSNRNAWVCSETTAHVLMMWGVVGVSSHCFSDSVLCTGSRFSAAWILSGETSAPCHTNTSIGSLKPFWTSCTELDSTAEKHKSLVLQICERCYQRCLFSLLHLTLSELHLLLFGGW